MRSYNEHLAMTSPKVLADQAVYRSSAIFPFIINSKIDTKIHFLSYWFIKRKISKISFVMTLRSKNGKVLYKNSSVINEAKANEISLKKIFLNLGIFQKNEILGSIELEFFSSINMVFPYPAIIINLVSTTSSAFVHTCGRTFNDKLDKKNNNSELVPESGFDILGEKNFSPFFAFVNSSEKKKNQKLELKIINQFGESLKKQIKLGNLKKHETKFIFFLEKKDRAFLKNKKGTVSIKHKFKDFYPRFLAGNISNNKSISSLTHTYYDLSKVKRNNFWENKDKEIFHDSIISFPVFLEKDFYNELAIYPIFSKCEMNLDLQVFSEIGKLIFEKKNFLKFKKTHKKIIYVNLNKHFNKINVNKNKTYFIRIIINAKKKPLTRFKVALNIGQKNKKFNIPTNICFNSIVPNKGILKKPGTFKWGAIMNLNNSIICLSNINYLKNGFRKANIIMKIWRQQNNKFIERKFKLNDNGNTFLSFKNDDEIRKFLKNKTGWVTFQSDNPFVNGFYFENCNNGFIGGDHLF